MIVAGFGFREAATRASLEEALEQAAGAHRVDAFCVPEDKAGHPGLAALSHQQGLPVLTVPPGALAACATVSRSEHAMAHRGTGSVAEACALTGAGPGARLLFMRCISKDRTAVCALAVALENGGRE